MKLKWGLVWHDARVDMEPESMRKSLGGIRLRVTIRLGATDPRSKTQE
jgi:hypothetical protein